MVNSYKKNETTGNEVNSYMRNEGLESYAAQMKQTEVSGIHRARMVTFDLNLLKFKNKSLSVSISLKILVSLVDHSRKNLGWTHGRIDKPRMRKT